MKIGRARFMLMNVPAAIRQDGKGAAGLFPALERSPPSNRPIRRALCTSSFAAREASRPKGADRGGDARVRLAFERRRSCSRRDLYPQRLGNAAPAVNAAEVSTARYVLKERSD